MSEVTDTTRHHTASAVVVDPTAGKVLLIHHKLTGKMQFPGGHIDADETGDECAIREVLEETGVYAALWRSASDQTMIPGAVRHITPIMVCEFPAPADPDPAWLEPAHHHLDLLYLATADSTRPTRPQEDEVEAAAWWPITGMYAANIRPDVPVVLGIVRDLLWVGAS
jgi:8-oxo-dGTP pyrophosphatase MutT (NUDIX family)